MLTFIGLGYALDITKNGEAAIKKANKVYIDAYTTPLPTELFEKIYNKLSKLNDNVILANRTMLESSLITNQAKYEDIAIVVVGDPFFATTHISLIIDAKNQGIPYKIISNASIINVAWQTGINPYKLGRVVTISFWTEHYKPISPIQFIDKNNSIGLHSLVLLDIEEKTRRPMHIIEALDIVKKMEKSYGKRVVNDIIIIKNAGLNNEAFFYGNIDDALKKSWEKGIYSFIALSKLSPIEKEHLVICKRI